MLKPAFDKRDHLLDRLCVLYVNMISVYLHYYYILHKVKTFVKSNYNRQLNSKQVARVQRPAS